MKNQRMKTKARSFGFSAIAIVVLMLATLICNFTVLASADEFELTVKKEDLKFELNETTAGIYTKVYDGTTAVTVSLTDEAKARLPESLTVEAFFNSPNVQEAEYIEVTFKLSGKDAESYVAPRAFTVPAEITPRELTWVGNGTAEDTYRIGVSSYEGLAVTLPTLDTTNVVALNGAPEAVAVQGTYTADLNNVEKAGDYTAHVNVVLDNSNYVAKTLDVDVKIKKIFISEIDWNQDFYEFEWNIDGIYPTIKADGYDAAGNAYELLIGFDDENYGKVGEHLITAILPDPTNMEFVQDNITHPQNTVRISKLQIEVSMEDVTHVLNDGENNPPTFNIAVLGDIPADIRELITYYNGNEPFNGVTACGAYTVTAKFPSSENYEFVCNGVVVGEEGLTATLYVNKQYVHAGSDGDEGYEVILIGENGFAGDAKLTVTIPEKLARKAIKGFRYYKAYTVSVTGAADQTFTALIPISDYLYQNDCDTLTAADIYVYESATGTMVKASEMTGYNVKLENGYYRVEGVSGNGSVTFVIAPVYHTPFFLSALGITLLVLLALLLLLLLPLLVGMYLRRVRDTSENEAMVIDEGEVPEVEPVVLEDNTDEDALLEGTADAIADSIDVDAATDEANTEGVEEAVAESMQEMLDEAAAIELDEEPVADAAEDLADAKADELMESVDAEVAEAEADEDALRAAVAAAMAENFNESADAEDAVAVAVVAEEIEEEMTPEEFKAVVDAIVSDAMLRTMDIPALPEDEASEETTEEATEEIVEEVVEDVAEEVVEEAVEEAVEETAEEAVEEATEEVAEEVTEETVEETVEEVAEEVTEETTEEVVEEAEDADVCAIVADSVAEAFELVTVDGVVPSAVEGTTYETITDAVKDAADANVPETWTEELTAEVVTAVTDELAARLLTEATEEVAEEAVEAFAPVETEDEDDDRDDDDDDDTNSFGGFAGMDLDFIDVMAEPEKYAEMLEQEARGEVQLVTRYRRSFQSRLIQSQGNVQEYYNILKNALLSYKGVKNRISWNYEAFNRGRVHVAKMNAKTKTLYLYLALDPEELADTKYGIVDVSSKKKYATVPVLMKIKGDRKFKYALELIAKLCGENLELPKLEIEDVDYRVPYQTTEDLVQAGVIKKLVASVPVTVYGAASTEEAPVENTPSAATEAQEVTFIAPTTAPAVEEAAAEVAEEPVEAPAVEEIPADAPASEDEPKEV